MWVSNPGTLEAQTRSTLQRGFQEMKIKCGHMVSPHPQVGDACTTSCRQIWAPVPSQAKEQCFQQKSTQSTRRLWMSGRSWKKTDFDVLAPWALENTGSVGLAYSVQACSVPAGASLVIPASDLWPLPLLSRAATSRHSLFV